MFSSFKNEKKTEGPSIGIANLPNQRHKIVSRKGANFTIMVVGKLLIPTVFTKWYEDVEQGGVKKIEWRQLKA